jgi:AcrR family transcriptional regulator
MENNVFYPKVKRGQTTFRKIINAATKIFYEKGYANSTIADIANEADVAVGTIYIYFKDKYTIYYHVVKDFQNKIRVHLNKHVKGLTTRKEKEEAGVRAWLMFILKYHRTYEMIWESLYIDRSIFEDYYLSFAKSYVYSLKKSQEELNDVDLETVAYMLMGISNFVGLQVLLTKKQEEIDVDNIVKTVTKILNEGLFKSLNK